MTLALSRDTSSYPLHKEAPSSCVHLPSQLAESDVFNLSLHSLTSTPESSKDDQVTSVNSSLFPPVRCRHIDKILEQSVSKDASEEFEKTRSLGQRISDHVTHAVGTWKFILAETAVIGAWVAWNLVPGLPQFDPYPFSFLNWAVGCQGILLAPILMMSQNRQDDQDRIAARINHEVNLKAEIGVDAVLGRIEELQHKVDELGKKAA